jgi:N-acetylmuramic acid 6-phosphate etherase
VDVSPSLAMTDLPTNTTRVLGIEGGGTKSAWVLLRCAGTSCETERRGKLPGANWRLTSHEEIAAMFRELPRDVDRVGVFLAGCVTLDDLDVLRQLAASVWTNAQLTVGSDRDSGIAAALRDTDGIVVNAGTGASVTGRLGNRVEKAGGWGHVLGDTGGGYFLAMRALRMILHDYDVRRGEQQFAARILNALCLNTLNDLVRWAQAADKMTVAMLAREVFAAARDGDARANEIIELGARALAEYTAAVAQRLAFDQPTVRLIGGLFREQGYVAAFRRELQPLVGADVAVATDEPEFGAAFLAMRGALPIGRSETAPLVRNDVATAATEQANPRSELLDQLSSSEIVELFVTEERTVEEALRACAESLARTIDLVADALKNGGRMFYVGAGTSGRLGVLDASEIPPTFGAAPELVQGIIAGGATALHRSVEGAEDDREAGAFAVVQRGVSARDIVLGISASGRTPFVLGAVERARGIGAKTVLLSCNPQHAPVGCNIAIDLPTGAEIVTGSTRLKAGTATKIALNIVSTGAMIRLGRVRGNLMVDVQTTNEKLRDRAVRIVAQACACDATVAREKLENASWNVRAAIDEHV